jgi:hypothetical protein
VCSSDLSISTFNPFVSSTPVFATAISNRFEDKSPDRINITTVGNVRITKNAPFENYGLKPKTYSVYFDGTTDVLNIQGNFQYFRNSGANNQGDFCVEGWFYPRKTSTSYLWTIGNESAGRYNCFIAGNKLSLNLFGASTTPLGIVPSNTWTHVAIVRANAIVSAYINGTLSNATILSGNIGNNTYRLIPSVLNQADLSTATDFGLNFNTHCVLSYIDFKANVALTGGQTAILRVYKTSSATTPIATLTLNSTTQSIVLNTTSATFSSTVTLVVTCQTSGGIGTGNVLVASFGLI